MNTGDLVEVNAYTAHGGNPASEPMVSGIVVNVWKNHLRKVQFVDVLLATGEVKKCPGHSVWSLNESR